MWHQNQSDAEAIKALKDELTRYRAVMQQALTAFEKMPFQNSEMVGQAASALREALGQ